MAWLARLLQRAVPGGAPAGPAASEPGRLLEDAIAEYNARRWATAEPLFRAVITSPESGAHDREVARNIYGRLLERNRRIEEAIAVYEASVAEGVVGSHSYERLAQIYRKLGRHDDELRVLERVVGVVEREVAAGRGELEAPLGRLRSLLAATRDRRRH